MNEKINNGSESSNGEEYECYICHHKLPRERALPFGGGIICPRCLRKYLIPVLIILVIVILIIILFAIF